MAKGILKFDKDKCKACELCVAVCPKHILEIHDIETNGMGYHTISVTDMDLCIACGFCGLICPDGVINVYQREDSDL